MSSSLELRTEIPFEERITSHLGRLFVGGSDERVLTWREDIEAGPFQDTFHSPLAQLWYMYQYCGGILMPKVGKNKSSFTGNVITTPHIDLLNNAAVVETEGNPGDMLDLIFSDETSMSTGLDVYIKEKIGEFK